ncbi:NAD(P)H-binding protein [Pandoraea nosoerga]|uniref:NAD(P)H-binding protein n=1 Tax=Pandoraea nosoerga TaxID=2508296 RepID=UPI001242944A
MRAVLDESFPKIASRRTRKRSTRGEARCQLGIWDISHAQPTYSWQEFSPACEGMKHERVSRSARGYRAVPQRRDVQFKGIQMKVLVIGATGYVGARVARKLKDKGFVVHGLARSESSRAKIEAAGYVPVEGDLLKRDTLRAAVTQMDAVSGRAVAVRCAAGGLLAPACAG